jgi:hypothetical protein
MVAAVLPLQLLASSRLGASALGAHANAWRRRVADAWHRATFVQPTAKCGMASHWGEPPADEYGYMYGYMLLGCSALVGGHS